MKHARALVTTIVLAAIVGGGALASRRVKLSNDVGALLSSVSDKEQAAVARELARSELSRTMILCVRATDAGKTTSATHDLARRLRSVPLFERVFTGVDESINEAVFSVYFPARIGMWSQGPEHDAGVTFSDAGIDRALSELKSELSLPTGVMTRQLAPRDPFGFFSTILNRFESANSQRLEVRDGVFVTANEQYGVVFAVTRASALDGSAQRKVQNALERARQATTRSVGASVSILQGGIHRNAVAAETTIRTDISRISILSTVGTILLFLFFFWSPRSLLLTMAPVLTGLSAGAAAVALIFHEVHGLTLAFGASLIGVCVDYPIHLVTHHAFMGRDSESEETVYTAIWLAGGTTIAGLIGLGWTDFPGIREIAVFATVGVATALLVTRYALPAFLPEHPRTTRFANWAVDVALRTMTVIRTSRFVSWAMLAACLVVCAIGLPRLRWTDDLSKLHRADETIDREDRTVRSMISRADGRRFVLARGSSEEEALERSELAHQALEKAVHDHELSAFRDVHPWLWSKALQGRNVAAISSASALNTRFATRAELAGFEPAAFAPFFDDLREPFRPITLRSLNATAMSAWIRPFLINEGSKVTFITYLEGVRNLERLRERISPLDGVTWFDQGAFMAHAYGTYRQRTFELTLIGLLAVLAVLWLRYRNVRLSLAGLLPPVLAGVTLFGIVGLTSQPASIMHLMALMLVLSMGADFAIFLLEHRAGERGLGAALISVWLNCATNVMSFGLLAMSTYPALQNLGFAISVGSLVAFALAPVALFFVPKDREEKARP